MKIWNTYPFEHSMNLVMIGRFKEVRDAEESKRLIDNLVEQVTEESGAYLQDSESYKQRFSETMLRLLTESHLNSLHPSELEQFEYDVGVEAQGSQVRIATDEVDVSAFLKVLLDKGARVEIYSAHDYPDTETDIEDHVE